jgi:Brp/Blh family beta-carotene 15,15'-monooxygenase
MIDISNNKLYVPIIAITLAFGILGWWQFDVLRLIEYPLLVTLVLLVGLPHGATDFLLFQRIIGVQLTRNQVFRFFIYYLGAVLGYFLVWLFFPVFALILFLGFSAYHFGQSNWHYLKAPRWLSSIVYMVWGSFALGGAILWHWEESSIFIQQLIGSDMSAWSAATMGTIQWVLLLVTFLLTISLRLLSNIGHSNLVRELLNLGVLAFMLYFTPLLVGFTLYFTLWHSLESMLNQVKFFKGKWPTFTLVQYYRQATPYTVLAVIGLIGLICCHSLLFNNISLISIFLIFISCVTLPHLFLIEESFK